MNHLKTHKTSLMAPWDPLNAPLDPLGTPGPAPPSIPNDPKTGLLNHSPAFQITRRPIKCHCWSYGTSYPSPSGLYSLVLPSSESSPGYISRTYLVQFGLVKLVQCTFLGLWTIGHILTKVCCRVNFSNTWSSTCTAHCAGSNKY